MVNRLIFIMLSILLTGISVNAEKRTNSSTHSEEKKFIFHAVLDGLYESGLKDDAVNAVVGSDFSENFIYACPICHPIYDAFQVYSVRPSFYGSKSGARDFGDGLTKDERAILLGKDSLARRKQIRTLVSKWIEKKIKSQNLNNKEKEDLRKEFEKMSEKGTEMLKTWQDEWTEGQKTMTKVKKQLEGAGIDDRTIHNILFNMRNGFLGRNYENWEFCPSCDGVTLEK